MVEQDQHAQPTTQQQSEKQHHTHKTVTLSYDAGRVLPFDTALEHKYAVWAMVKNPQQHHH